MLTGRAAECSGGIGGLFCALYTKVREGLVAQRIERVLDKDRILELYLNEIYLGNRAYGVAAAALNYFNKPLSELTVSEAAYLAILPKGPANYQLPRHHDRAIDRRNYAIGRMLERGYITAEQADGSARRRSGGHEPPRRRSIRRRFALRRRNPPPGAGAVRRRRAL